jgi:hypothetical protein
MRSIPEFASGAAGWLRFGALCSARSPLRLESFTSCPYRADPIVSDDVDKRQGRLALVASLKHTLSSAFGVLGIAAPERWSAHKERWQSSSFGSLDVAASTT